MSNMTLQYLGDLRCEATHLRSGKKIITDAPPDNQGKGEAFSPTDLLCTALAACMTTLIGIAAHQKNIPLGNIQADIEKMMGSHPRRVTGIRLRIKIEDMDFTPKEKEIIRNAALTCPVSKSLHPDIHQDILFEFEKGKKQVSD